MKIEAYSLVDFQVEDGLFHHIFAVKTRGLLFNHYYKLTLECTTPMTLPEEVFDAIEDEKIKLSAIRSKGKEMSLGRLYFKKFNRDDIHFYGTEYKWEECRMVALLVQSGYIERQVRSQL